MAKITFEDKVDVRTQSVARKNKAVAADFNEIKTVVNDLDDEVADKQDELVSGTNIKTLNGEDITGSGDLDLKSNFTASGTKNEVLKKPILFPALDFVDGNAAPPVEASGNAYVLVDEGNGAVDSAWDGLGYTQQAIFNGTTWVGITPEEGVICYNKANNKTYTFNGSKWLVYISVEILFTEIEQVLQKFQTETTFTSIELTNIDTLSYEVNETGGFTPLSLPGDLPLTFSAGDTSTWQVAYSSGKDKANVILKGYEL